MARNIELKYESSPRGGLVSSSDLKSVILALPETLKANIAQFRDDLAISSENM